MESYEELFDFEIIIIFKTTDLFSWNTIRSLGEFSTFHSPFCPLRSIPATRNGASCIDVFVEHVCFFNSNSLYSRCRHREHLQELWTSICLNKLVQTQVCVISCRTNDRRSFRHIWQSYPPLPPIVCHPVIFDNFTHPLPLSPTPPHVGGRCVLGYQMRNDLRPGRGVGQIAKSSGRSFVRQKIKQTWVWTSFIQTH